MNSQEDSLTQFGWIQTDRGNHIRVIDSTTNDEKQGGILPSWLIINLYSSKTPSIPNYRSFWLYYVSRHSVYEKAKTTYNLRWWEYHSMTHMGVYRVEFTKLLLHEYIIHQRLI